MMKSFFKKLSLVMALAMVVSAMAPAATASAADALGIVVQNDTTWTVLETDVVEEIGAEVVDYQYKGAPANYKELDPTWDSSDKTVATVDKYGKVTTLKDGVTTISITLSNGQKGELELTVGKGNVNMAAFDAEMLSDSVAKLTFNDTTIKEADLKEGLEFSYYVTADYAVTVPLIEKIESKGNGVFYATLYKGATFQDGTVYEFDYNGYTDDFTCVIGNVTFAELTVNGKTNPVVEVSEDSYSFAATLYNEKGQDITATALASGVSVEYEVSEDEEGRYSAVDESSVIFHEAATATVKVTCFKLDDEGERITLVDALPYTVVAKTPDPYDITFNETPAFTIVPAGTAVNWTKGTNSKLAVGDEGYELLVKLADNKKKEVGSDGNYYKDGTTNGEWNEGSFRFVSTNVSRLYVTDDGALMPNASGKVNVLLYYTANVENAKEKLVAAVELNVSAPRAVGTTSLSATKKVLSTVAVNKSNETTITVNVTDTLGDKVGVEGVKAKVECTTAATALKNNAAYPVISETAPVVADGKLTFTISADATTLPSAGKSQTYNYKVTVGSKTETFSITVKAPTTTTSFTKYAMIFGDAKIEDATNLNKMQLSVGLAGVSNSVTAAKLDIAGAKLKAENAVKGNFYYSVTKDGTDITEKITSAATGGTLYIDLTTTKSVDYYATSGATKEALTVVDLVQGAGKYTVTIYEAKADSKGKLYFNPLSGAKDTYTVANALPTVGTVATKLAPTYAGTDVQDAVMSCFKFTVGDKTFDDAADYAGYKIAIDENPVIGDVCFVNSVTFYKESKVTGVYINCGTVTVNDYVTFVTE